MSETSDHNTMSPKKRGKTAAHTLTRVRNNQRRHRQRRREYISSMELKLQETERLLTQSKKDVAALKAEVARWESRANGTAGNFEGLTGSRSMPDDVGMPPALFPVEQQPTEAGQGQSTGDDELRQASPLAPSSTFASATAFATSAVTPDLPASISTSISFRTTDLLTHSIVPSPELSSTSVTGYPGGSSEDVPSTSIFPTRCCSSIDEPSTASLVSTAVPSSSAPEAQDITLLSSTCHAYPPADFESTTQCSLAYTLIAQQNFQGLDEHAITRWLYQGFRQAKIHEEGCRVENTLLFGLLDFISGA